MDESKIGLKIEGDMRLRRGAILRRMHEQGPSFGYSFDAAHVWDWFELISASTIRRDLKALERDGLVCRIDLGYGWRWSLSQEGRHIVAYFVGDSRKEAA